VALLGTTEGRVQRRAAGATPIIRGVELTTRGIHMVERRSFRVEAGSVCISVLLLPCLPLDQSGTCYYFVCFPSLFLRNDLLALVVAEIQV